MTAARAKAPPARSKKLITLQIAKRDLRLDDDVYRDVLELKTGQRSASGLDDLKLGEVLDHFRDHLGWKPTMVKGGRNGARPKRADHPVAKKARAMWISLQQLGVVENASEQALEAFAKRQLRVERMQWMDQGLGFKLIEALKDWAKREGWDQDLSGIEKKLHIRVLKTRLAWAQAKRLGERFSAMGMSDAALDAAIAAYAKRIQEARRG